MKIGRKIGLIGLIGLMMVLAGCAGSSEDAAPVKESGRPIAFRSYTAVPTRSSAVYSAENGIDRGQSIGIYAYLHDNSTWEADQTYNDAAALEDPKRLIPNFMWNQQATCLTKGTDFEYSPLKYWPNESNDKVSFIAYFPYTVESPGNPDTPAYPANATGLQTLLANSASGLPTFNFTVKEAAADQVDFLLTELLPNLPNGTNGVSPSGADDRSGLTVTDHVRFLFHHMTSKVEFRIVAADNVRDAIAHFKLNSLSVTNLYKDGKLTPTYSAGTTTYAWSEQSAKHGTAPYYTFGLNTQTSYLFMPQTLSNDVMLNLEYTVTLKSDGTTYTYDSSGNLVPQEEYTYGTTASIQLNTMKFTGRETALTEWLPNHHYVYYIRIGARAIEFTGEVVAWGDEIKVNDIEIKEP